MITAGLPTVGGHHAADCAQVVGGVREGAQGPAYRFRAGRGVPLDGPAQVLVPGAQLALQAAPACPTLR